MLVVRSTPKIDVEEQSEEDSIEDEVRQGNKLEYIEE